MADGNRHTRFVGAAKIVFPLLALGLLSTIFLFSRVLDPSAAIPFSDIDVEKIAQEQILSGPRFSGVTDDGTSVSLRAASARPDLGNPKRLSAQDIAARIETTGGNIYDIVSDSAAYDGDRQTLDLSGDVQIDSSGGYRFTTQDLSADLAKTGLVAPGPIQGTAPGGTLTAGSMELQSDGVKQLLVFKNGVKLVYQPQR